MSLKSALFCIAFAFPGFALASVQVLDATGASVFDDDTSSKPIIYAGTAGLSSTGECAISSLTEVCNNCPDGEPSAPCNPRRILPTTVLTIELVSDKTGGVPRAARTDGSGLPSNVPSSTVSVNERGFYNIEWSDLCASLPTTAGDPSCETNISSLDMKVGIDGNNDGDLSDEEDDFTTVTVRVHKPADGRATINECADPTITGGICGFLAFPGDEKVYIKEIKKATDFPASGGIQITQLRILLSDTNFSSIDLSPDTDYEDIRIQLDSDGQAFLEPNTVEGLENGVTYYFKVATRDQAGNLADLTSTASINATCGSPPESDETCPFRSTPDEVIGLLAEDFNCFIATAAYGSSLESHVGRLREFRNKYLIDSDLGRQFVNLYYNYGPYAARFIHRHEWTKPFARTLIWPAWVIADWSLKYGIKTVGLFGLLLLISMTGIFFAPRITSTRRSDY